VLRAKSYLLYNVSIAQLNHVDIIQKMLTMQTLFLTHAPPPPPTHINFERKLKTNFLYKLIQNKNKTKNLLFLEAEMGADFNILEYADPELDTIAGGEKTNILDLDLEQVEVDPKDDKQKKETRDEEQKSELTGPTSDITDSCSTSTSLTLTENSNVSTITSPQATSQTTSQAMQAQVVQQQMHQQVQQAAAMGRPIPPGTRLLSPDGAVGVVTSTNTVTVSYPSNFSGHPQRLSQAHIQGKVKKIIYNIIFYLFLLEFKC